MSVAILDDGAVFKHWGVLIEKPKAAESILLQVMGSDGRFRYEPETGDVRDSTTRTLVELVYLCDVDVTEISSIETVASRVTVHSEIRGWNCQDYVLDLLDALENEGIVYKEDAGYKSQKSLVRGKQEGFA